MDFVTQGLGFIFVYSDDILVASRNEREHTDHLRQLFSRLREHGLIINTTKCKLAASELKEAVTAKGISSLQDRIEAICNFPRPNTVKQLQRYLGMINFYRRFVRNIARTPIPLYVLTKEKKLE